MSYPLSLFLSTECRLFNPYFKAYCIINYQKCFFETIYLWVNSETFIFMLFLWNIKDRKLSISVIVKAVQGFYLYCNSTLVEDFFTCLLVIYLFSSLLTESWFFWGPPTVLDVELLEGRFMAILVCADGDWSSAGRVTQGASGKGLISSKKSVSGGRTPFFLPFIDYCFGGYCWRIWCLSHSLRMRW